MQRWKTVRQSPPGGTKNRQAGLTLIEVIVAIGLLGVVAVGFFGALNTVSKGRLVRDQWETAKNLAESQMEFIKQQSFAPSYASAPVPSDYSGYMVSILADNLSTRDSNIQKIRIVVSYLGRAIIVSDNATLVGYKVRR